MLLFFLLLFNSHLFCLCSWCCNVKLLPNILILTFPLVAIFIVLVKLYAFYGICLKQFKHQFTSFYLIEERFFFCLHRTSRALRSLKRFELCSKFFKFRKAQVVRRAGVSRTLHNLGVSPACCVKRLA